MDVDVLKRVPVREQEPKVRATNFEEVCYGYDKEEAMAEASRCLNCKNAQCVKGCPVSINIPAFVEQVKNGDFTKAYEVISESSALPAVCGRVCPQESQCEGKCIRGFKGDPVSIGKLERFVADTARENGIKPKTAEKKNGIKVAVIGSGPAGLTCAGDLAKLGYDVTIFEALHAAGGVLSYGIPEFRLPKDKVVAAEVENVKSLGVKIETNVVIGKSVKIDELMENEQNLMTSNEDNCLLQWGDNADTRNYFYDYLVINRESNLDKLHSAGESILMYMAPYADPRLEKFFTPANAASMPDNFHWAPYWGQPKVSNLPSGVSLSPNPHSGKTADDYSQLQDKFTEQSYAEVIMNYAEVCLLKSELVHKGLGSGSQTAEAYYNAGVNASMVQYGVDGGKVNNYLQTPGIKWNTLTDLTVTEEGEDYYKDFIGIVSSAITSDEPDPIYRQIIMQQYIAMFYQSLDAWTLIRRSQVLEFPPHFSPETGYGAVNAGTKDNPYVPQRLVYPDSEKTNNEYELTKGIANLDGGQDAMSTKLWFALPTKTNPYLTNN